MAPFLHLKNVRLDLIPLLPDLTPDSPLVLREVVCLLSFFSGVVPFQLKRRTAVCH